MIYYFFLSSIEEQTMASKKNWLGMLILALVFGMVVVGNIEAQTDSRLNGTWDMTGASAGAQYIFSNGNFVFFSLQSGSIISSGTYTTNGNTLKLVVPDTEEETYVYSVNGNTLTLRTSRGRDFTLSKAQEEGIEPALIGKWVPETGQRISSDFIQKRAELKNDGTGTADGLSLTWTAKYGRLTVKLDRIGIFIYEYNITGSTLVLTYVGKSSGSVRYKKE